MPTTLTFDRADVLREGERELGHVTLSTTGAYMAVAVGERSYDIVRRGRHAWHFSLMDRLGPTMLCEFHQYLVRQGGRLTGGSTQMRLRSKLFGSSAWTISSPGGASFAVSHRPHGRRRRQPGEGPLAMVTNSTMPALVLSCEEPLPATQETIPMLIFACWLIVEWERIPGGDAGASIGMGL
jgi:hypothetical protein